MVQFARVVGSVVVELVLAADQAEIDSSYHPDFASQFIEDAAGDAVLGGTHDGTDFIDPVAPDLTPSVDDIKLEANRRIELVMPMWMVAREVSGGTAITQTVKDDAQAIRDFSATLEGTLPEDYTADSHWTA